MTEGRFYIVAHHKDLGLIAFYSGGSGPEAWLTDDPDRAWRYGSRLGAEHQAHGLNSMTPVHGWTCGVEEDI